MILKISNNGQMKEIEIIKAPHDIRVDTENGKNTLHCVRCGAVFGQWESNAQLKKLKEQKCGAVIKK